MPGPDLNFQLQTPQGILDLRLAEGENLVIGRLDKCSIKINDPSVSSEHLRLSWDGQKLKIEDLNSSNGVFSLTHKERIHKKEIPVGELTRLELRLSSSVQLSLIKTENKDTRYSQVQTEILGASLNDQATKIVLGVEMPQEPLSGEISETPKLQKPVPKSAQVSQQVAARVNPIENTKNSEEFYWFLRVILSVLVFAGLFLFWKALYKDLWNPTLLWRQSGAAYDMFLLHMLSAPKWLSIVIGVLFVCLVVSVVLPSLVKQFVKSSLPRVGVSKRLGKPLMMMVLLLGALLPFLFCVRAFKFAAHLVSLGQTFSQTRYVHLQLSKSPAELLVLHKNLERLRGPLQGSSIGFLLAVQVERSLLLQSCEGTGITKSFELKRPCLVELANLYRRQKEQWAPEVIADLASDMVLLGSLDTMVSLLAQAKDDPLKDVEKLAVALLTSGFLREGDLYIQWIQDSKLDRLAKYALLQGERRKIENELLDNVRSQKLPLPLVPSIPSPLELGL